MTLDELKNGQRATIMSCDGNDLVSIRLMELGIVEGELIERTGQAPLGDPLEYLVNGTRLSIRKQEARRVIVQLLDH